MVHLAAAKHVPYGERFPEGAVAANVLATDALLELCAVVGVKNFVYPSSDKSVAPPSVYGATKRLAEGLVQAQALDRRWAIVRYVNIIGTRGSVVETFTQQVQDDRSLSVTDERMTRYWISMDEAVWCCPATGACASPGEIVMPACGEPCRCSRRRAAWPAGIVPSACPIRSRALAFGRANGCTRCCSRRTSHLPKGRRRACAPCARLAHHGDGCPSCRAIVDELRRGVEVGDRDGLRRLCLAAAEALQ